jgi:hypothetical protein
MTSRSNRISLDLFDQNCFPHHSGPEPVTDNGNSPVRVLLVLWPVNLTDLENFVKRYLGDGGEIASAEQHDPRIDCFPECKLTAHTRGNAHAAQHIVEPAHSLKTLVRNAKGEAEKNAISSALEKTRWNRKAAARLLRVSYRALLYKIQQYHMTPPESYFSQLETDHVTKGNGEGFDPVFATAKPRIVERGVSHDKKI